MKALAIVVLQVLLALILAGLLLPALLVLVPATRTAGPLAMAVLVGLLFVALRLAWPSRAA